MSVSRARDLPVLTRKIATCAPLKHVAEAESLFSSVPLSQRNIHLSAALLNVYVCSGMVEKATKLFESLLESERSGVEGSTLNIVLCTTMLKLFATSNIHGALEESKRILAIMTDDSTRCPPIGVDVRALNTFIRGCEVVGDVEAAVEVFEGMGRDGKYAVIPDDVTIRLVGKLLMQGLKVKRLRRLVVDYGKGEGGIGGNCGGGPVGAKPCLFWEDGKCDRGVNCQYYHSPKYRLRQFDAAERETARQDTKMTLLMFLSQCEATLSKWKRCGKVVREAREVSHALMEAGDVVSVSNPLFWETRRREIRNEIKRIAAFRKEMKREGKKKIRLEPYFQRAFIFREDIQIQGQHGSSARDAVASHLLASLKTFGLNEYQRMNTKDGGSSCSFSHLISRSGHFKWKKIFFGSRKRARDGTRSSLPIKLEICSGNGDWVCAQAKGDVGKANWCAMELRHSRVYNIFSRMVFESVPNLCIVGGDASKILPKYVRRIDHIYINFPEPPHWSGDSSAENENHLLTEAFFQSMFLALKSRGTLIIFSDNKRYCISLAKTLANLSPKRFYNAENDSCTAVAYEDIAGIHVHNGVPRSYAANHVTSYFDRFWQEGQHVERCYLNLTKRE